MKTRIDQWLRAAGIESGRIFRPVNKADVLSGAEMRALTHAANDAIELDMASVVFKD